MYINIYIDNKQMNTRECSWVLLSTSADIHKYISFLMSHAWTTQKIDMVWLIRNGMMTYILQDYTNPSLMYGFVVYDRMRQTLHSIELLPQYQRQGYGSTLLRQWIAQDQLHVVYSKEPIENHPFWSKFNLLYITM